MILSFYAHLPAVRADGDGLKVAEKLLHLIFCEVVGENAAAPPKCSRLHLFALSGSHILIAKIPEEEPPSGHEHARCLASEGAPVCGKQMSGDMKGEDCIKALLPQGQATGIGLDEVGISPSTAGETQCLRGNIQADHTPVAGQRREGLAVAAAQLQDTASPQGERADL